MGMEVVCPPRVMEFGCAAVVVAAVVGSCSMALMAAVANSAARVLLLPTLHVQNPVSSASWEAFETGPGGCFEAFKAVTALLFDTCHRFPFRTFFLIVRRCFLVACPLGDGAPRANDGNRV
eukprot:7654043-Pyramimonas_sp.AAC.2